MRPEQARELKPSDVVIWCGNDSDRGTVIKADRYYIEILWASHGKASIHPNDCQNVGWPSETVWERSEQEYDPK